MATLIRLPLIFLLLSVPSLVEAGSWTPLVNAATNATGGLGPMLLLSDGTVIAQWFGGTQWYKLTPDIHGSYANGTWSQIAPMNDTRLYFSSQVLMDGRVYVAGGEYGSGNGQGETDDPVTNVWTMAPGRGHN